VDDVVEKPELHTAQLDRPGAVTLERAFGIVIQ
jgi:hypothetical protein